MKKVFIFIILVFVLGVVSIYSCLENSKRIKQEKIIGTIESTNQEEIVDNIIKETKEQNVSLENTLKNEENNEIQYITQNEQVKTNKIITPNEINKKIIVNEEKTQKENTLKQELDKTKNKENQEQSTTNENQEKNIEKQKNNNAIEKREEYRQNNKMIEKITNIIENNNTEDMKNFGYRIEIDSSIKELTNQFTYSEERVKAYLKNKFGTIRIYAEDYYCNGEFIMTECYII